MLAKGLTIRNYMLKIKNLHAKVNEKAILKGLNLNVKPGELHAIMGRNASGKSTLAHVLAGRDIYNITKGEVLFDGQDLLDMEQEESIISCYSFFEDEIKSFKNCSPSGGIMIESFSDRLLERGEPHYMCHTKKPELRINTIKAAENIKYPMTTGLLIGIGQNQEELVGDLFEIANLTYKKQT